MKPLILSVLLSASVNYYSFAQDNPYCKWGILSINTINIDSVKSIDYIYSWIRSEINTENLCNIRSHAKVRIDSTRYFDLVFYKYCPFDEPIKVPNTKYFVNKRSFELHHGNPRFYYSLDSIIETISINKSIDSKTFNFGLVWETDFSNKDFKEIIIYLHDLYSSKFSGFVEGLIEFHNYPVVFFAIKDNTEWEYSDSVLPSFNLFDSKDTMSNLSL
jgi:hypothetical protein